MDNILDWSRRVLTTTPARWENMAHTLPAALLARQPAPGQWSALECLRHMLDSDAVYTARLSYLRAGQDFPDFNPVTDSMPLDAALAPQALAAEFTRLRQASLAALGEITVDDLGCRARHSALGPVTLGEMLHNWAAHDFQHTMQAERAVMQPFILGSGPWLVNLREHLLT